MDLRKLKKLIELVEESSIAELEITEGEEKVRISKIRFRHGADAHLYPLQCSNRYCHPHHKQRQSLPIADTNNAY